MACDECGQKLSPREIGQWVGIGIFPGDQYQRDDKGVTMVAIALAESGGCVSCNNGGCCTGLWQIHKQHAGKVPGSPSNQAEFVAWLRNADNNAKAARWVWEQQGFGAWEAYTNGAYRQFLDDAEAEAGDVAGRAGPGGDLSLGDALGDLADLSPANAIKLLVAPLENVAGVVLDAARWLGDPHNWVRILYVGAGVAGVLLAASIVAKPFVTQTVRDVRPV